MVELLVKMGFLFAVLIAFLYSGCTHKWKTIKTEELVEEQPKYEVEGETVGGEMVKVTRYHLRCSECGEIEHRDVK